MTAALLIPLALAPTGWAASQHNFDPDRSLAGTAADPGSAHPPLAFKNPCGTALDTHGDVYVADGGYNNQGQGVQGRIDVFDPQGLFLLEIKDQFGPCGVAVDSEGNLYVIEGNTNDVVRYAPSSYPPTPATIYTPTVVYDASSKGNPLSNPCLTSEGVAVDPSNGHLYVSHICRTEEYASVTAGNSLLREELGTPPPGNYLTSIEVCGKNHDIFLTGVAKGESAGDPTNSRIFVLNGADGALIRELDGTNTPFGSFSFVAGKAGIALDQLNCELYVADLTGNGVVEQFTEAGGFVGELPVPPVLAQPSPVGDLAVDAPMVQGEVGYDSPNEGYAYVTSTASNGSGHLYAYKPRLVGPPSVQGQKASGVTEREATLEARLNPNGLETKYHFEYVTEADFLANGYANALTAPAEDVESDARGFFAIVAESVAGLDPGVSYRFRLVAENELGVTKGEGLDGGEGDDVAFSTYATPPDSTSCSNQELRSGLSASLPECRAYELVTPPGTNGRIPTIAGLGRADGSFPVVLPSPDGQHLIFGTEGGALPGFEGNGLNDTYEASRVSGGWQSVFTGLTGAQSQEPYPGGMSPDHHYAYWEARGCRGTLASCSIAANYLRKPDGSVEPVGIGSMGTEIRAVGRWLSEDGRHIVFATEPHNNAAPALRLEPVAAPTGTGAIYDRSPGGPTRVISLLPGNTPLQAGEDAEYVGASADGDTVAFRVGKALYVRVDNEVTREVVSNGAVLGALSQDGRRLVYLIPKEPPAEGEPPAGQVFVFNPRTGEGPTPIPGGDESILVNISADGSHVYFVSPKEIGGAGTPGGNNLYVWDGSAVHFVTTVSDEDVVGEAGAAGKVGGLGLWAEYAVGHIHTPAFGPAADPSRSTPDGAVLVFESHANLTSYDSGGHSEVYRYDAAASPGNAITCVSCNPTLAAAASDAQLQADHTEFEPFPPVNALTPVASVTSDGRAVFFETSDRLVSADVDHKRDVYEWTAPGVAACESPRGCVALISSGNSAGDDYLYAVTPSGGDVFFESGDLLTSQDLDATPSLYDARVGGGFAVEPASQPCDGNDTCKGPPLPPPAMTQAGSAGFQGPGNRHHGKPHKKKQQKHKKQKHHKRHKAHDKGSPQKKGVAR